MSSLGRLSKFNSYWAYARYTSDGKTIATGVKMQIGSTMHQSIVKPRTYLKQLHETAIWCIHCTNNDHNATKWRLLHVCNHSTQRRSCKCQQHCAGLVRYWWTGMAWWFARFCKQHRLCNMDLYHLGVAVSMDHVHHVIEIWMLVCRWDGRSASDAISRWWACVETREDCKYEFSQFEWDAGDRQ